MSNFKLLLLIIISLVLSGLILIHIPFNQVRPSASKIIRPAGPLKISGKLMKVDFNQNKIFLEGGTILIFDQNTKFFSLQLWPKQKKFFPQAEEITVQDLKSGDFILIQVKNGTIQSVQVFPKL